MIVRRIVTFVAILATAATSLTFKPTKAVSGGTFAPWLNPRGALVAGDGSFAHATISAGWPYFMSDTLILSQFQPAGWSPPGSAIAVTVRQDGLGGPGDPGCYISVYAITVAGATELPRLTDQPVPFTWTDQLFKVTVPGGLDWSNENTKLVIVAVGTEQGTCDVQIDGVLAR